MRRFLTVVIVAAIIITLHSCTGETKAKASDRVTEEKDGAPIAQASRKCEISFSPATITLGENREIFVHFTEGKIAQPDTQFDISSSLQVSFTLSVTNKSTPTNKRFFFLSRSDTFVELNNGQVLPITTGEGFASPDPATTNTICWSALIPKDATPLRLLLYYEKQRASIKLVTTEK